MTYPIQYIEARFWGRDQPGNDGAVVTAHTVESPCQPGYAPSLARSWFQSEMIGRDGLSHPASATWMVDPANTVQMVPESRIAWHCGNGNRRGIGIEHCGATAMSRQQWLSDYGIQTLRRSAERAAIWMMRQQPVVPTVKLTADQTRNGGRGVNGHNDMRLAYGGTTHTDPDEGRNDRFPWDVWLKMIDEFKSGKVPDDMTPDEVEAAVCEALKGRWLPPDLSKRTPIELLAQIDAITVRQNAMDAKLDKILAKLAS